MIDCIDSPLSLLVIAPALYSILLFGVGLLLPNCPCCTDEIECLGPFVKCRREECTSCNPKYGFSSSIRNNMHLGDLWNGPTTASTMRVCSKPQVSVSTRGDYFKSLSHGETLVITATQTKQKNGATATMRLAPEDQPIPAVFTVNVTGVDWPLELSDRTTVVGLFAPLGAYSTSINFGDTSLSTNAATAVTIKNAYLPFPDATYDGTVLTNTALVSLATATLTKSGGAFNLAFSVASPAALFPYTANGSSVFIGYTLEIQRGITKTYTDILLLWAFVTGQSPDAIPEGGLTPPDVPYISYDDVNTTPPPAPSQPTANVINTHSRSPLVLTTPTYTLDVSGDDLRFSFNHVVAAEQYAPFVTRSLSCVEYRYAWAPFGEIENDNFDEVDEFLAGLRCLSYTGDGVRQVQVLDDTKRPGNRVVPGEGEQWEVCLEPPNVLCGRGVCHLPELVAPETATFVNTPSAGACAGVSLSAVGQMFKCAYIASTSVCGAGKTHSNFESNIRSFSYYDILGNPRTEDPIPLSSFFKGDLLYSIENGPTVNSVAVGETLVTLGGTPFEGNVWATRFACKAIGPESVQNRVLASPSGMCPPLSLTVSVSEMGLALTKIEGGDGDFDTVPRPEGGTATAKAFCNSCDLDGYVGDPQGDYVLALTSLDCGSAAYAYTAPTNKDNSPVYGITSASASVPRSKCGEFQGETNILANVVAKVNCPETNGLEYETPTGLVPSDGWFGVGHVAQVGLELLALTSPSETLPGLVIRPWSFVSRTGSYACTLDVDVTLSDDFEPEATGKVAALCQPITITPADVAFYGNPPAGFKASREPAEGEQTAGVGGWAVEELPSPFGVNDDPLPKKRRWLSSCNVASVTYQSKPCGIVEAWLLLFGVFNNFRAPLSGGTLAGNLPSRAISGNLEPLYYQGGKCPAITITSPDWIEITANTSPLADNDYCVEISENTTGQPRSGKITLEPVWLVNGVPSPNGNHSTAVLGPFSYEITQDG